jgi:hypothetical protein
MKSSLLRSAVRMRCRAFAPFNQLDTCSSMQPSQCGGQQWTDTTMKRSNNLGSRLLPQALSSSSSSVSRNSSSSMLLPSCSGQLPALQCSSIARLWPSQTSRRMEQLQHVRCAASKASSKAKTVWRCSNCGSGEWTSWHIRDTHLCLATVM